MPPQRFQARMAGAISVVGWPAGLSCSGRFCCSSQPISFCVVFDPLAVGVVGIDRGLRDRAEEIHAIGQPFGAGVGVERHRRRVSSRVQIEAGDALPSNDVRDDRARADLPCKSIMSSVVGRRMMNVLPPTSTRISRALRIFRITCS